MKLLAQACILLSIITCTPKRASDKKPDASQNTINTIVTEPALRNKDDSLNIKIGQMIFMGMGDYDNYVETDSLYQAIASGLVGGVVFYEKNIPKSNAASSLKLWIATMQKKAKIPLFVSIDEEGGRVHRLKAKYGFFEVPSAALLGKIDNIDTTFYYTYKLAKLMADLGFNINCAPTVDLASNKANPVIYRLERSYSANAEKVTQHAEAAIRAHHKANVHTIIKHFPGHGSASVDSHLGMVDISQKWTFNEIIPFRALVSKGIVDGIMTGHLVNAHLDTNRVPATLSPYVIDNLLRGMVGHKGVVFSDDMQMHAISKNYGLENAIYRAISSGVDMLMFANNVLLKERNSPQQIHSIIKKMVSDGRISSERIDQSYKRIISLKNKKYQ